MHLLRGQPAPALSLPVLALLIAAAGDGCTSAKSTTVPDGGASPSTRPPAWRPSWPGTEMAVLAGDPWGTGPFVFRFRLPDGYWI